MIVFGFELRLPCYSIYSRKCQRKEDVAVLGRMILKWVYENCGVFIGSGWLRIKLNVRSS
jgi:hypothetical protein